MLTAVTTRIALPWVQAALVAAAEAATMPGLPALQWLAGRGHGGIDSDVSPWREWLLDGVEGLSPESLRRWPAGPCLALGCKAGDGGDVRTGTWCVAQPVHLAAGLDHLRLAPLTHATLTDAEAAALGDAIRSHFGADTVLPAAYVEGAWLLRFPGDIRCFTHAPDAVVGRDVHDYMPAGPDGAGIRSLMNEIQMLLHDHPVNQQRESSRRLPVNAWWLWGFGRIDAAPEDVTGLERWDLRTDDLWLRGLWRAHGAAVEPADAAVSPVRREHTLLAVAHPPADRGAESLAAIDAGLLSSLRAQLRAGTIRQLEVLLGERVLRIDATSRYRFWRRPADIARLLP